MALLQCLPESKVLEGLIDFWCAAQCLCCNRWMSGGTRFTVGSLPYTTFCRSQVDVLTILHKTTSRLFSRVSLAVQSSGSSAFSPFPGDCCRCWQKSWLYLELPSSIMQNTRFNELQHLAGQAFHTLLNLLHEGWLFSPLPLFLILNRNFSAAMLEKSLLNDKNGSSGSQMLGSCPPSFCPLALSELILVVLNEEANLSSPEAPHKCACS